MAVIHISEAEAARDLAGLLARAKSGQEIVIDSEQGNFRLSEEPLSVTEPRNPLLPRYTEPRLLSVMIAEAEARGSKAILDDRFGDDLEEIIRQNSKEMVFDPWAAS